MTHEYRASLTVTKSGTNGDIYKKCFSGTCAVGVNKRTNGSIAQKAEAYLQAVDKSLGNGICSPNDKLSRDNNEYELFV